ncbi:hypothetical protein [Cecembia rubra]|uniref:Uncharacterized protein n=1 Tax=Cecembia rubra TaxID=1485585 RepID=A0A2P8DYG3_9BACT|nr:hypothetical protein [Cecembia rubra]PSL02264.1 hypothetical protein CLV48_11047 [Cecembia rubra]
MKDYHKYLLFFLLMFSFKVTYSQNVIIHLDDRIVETSIVATSSEAIFTNEGNFKFSEIKKAEFKNFDPKSEFLYILIGKHALIEFQDGYPVENLNFDLDLSTEAQRKKAYNSLVLPEEYLVKAANNALIGIGIVAVGFGATILTDEPIPAIAGGVLGLVLGINAWVNVGKAGREMKLEREASLSKE